MASIKRYRPVWSGFTGGSGISTFFADCPDEQDFATAVWQFLKSAVADGAGGGLPHNCRISFPAVVDAIDDATGDQVGSLAVVAPAEMVGFGDFPYSSATGACVTWLTGAFIGGHQVKGRTFLVPLQTAFFENNGTLSDSKRTQINNAAAVYAADSCNPVVWHRPAPGASDGSSHAIIGGVCRDKTAILTSRRD